MIQEILVYTNVTWIQTDLRGEDFSSWKNVNYKEVLFGACSTVNPVML